MHRGFGVGFLQFFWTHEIKPLITLMQAFHACAARRCLRYAQTCFAAALELPTLFSNSTSNAKAAATAGFAEGKTATRCASVRRERARAVSKTEGLATRASA